MSASPLRTASKVPGGAATARGSALHLILPGTFCSIMAHHSTCVVLSACVGGTHVDSVSVVCAVAGAADKTAVTVINALAARLANKGIWASSKDGAIVSDGPRPSHCRKPSRLCRNDAYRVPPVHGADCDQPRERGTPPHRCAPSMRASPARCGPEELL